MSYAILRAKKLKTPAAIARSMRHTYREIPVPNADPDAPAPTVVGPRTTAEGMAKARERWPEKRRKDAVLAIEYLVTASPEAFKRHGGNLDETRYFNDALNWLRKRHGAENVIGAAVHRDETTPHLVAYVVPRDGDKLNCRKYLGGSACLSQMQDDFHQVCGQPHALDRGVKGSKARHTSIRQFYTQAKKAGEIPEVSKADLAAAAVGIYTDSYKKAQEAIRSVAKAALLAQHEAKAAKARKNALAGQEKALASREKSVDRRFELAELEAARLKQKQADLVKQESDLKKVVATMQQLFSPEEVKERLKAHKRSQEAKPERQSSRSGPEL